MYLLKGKQASLGFINYAAPPPLKVIDLFCNLYRPTYLPIHADLFANQRIETSADNY